MTGIPKILALIAFAMAAGCRDSYPSLQPPLDVFYFPVGLAVRQVQPVPGGPLRSQLVVVNSNFDLKYDLFSGGTVQVVDPEASKDIALGGGLSVLSALRVASFGGEVALAGGPCPPGWPDCPSACGTLSRDPVVAAGGAKVIFASRSAQVVYRASMDAAGTLSCDANCPYALPLERLDPYGVSIACSDRTGTPVAYAFVSHLVSANGLGWLDRIDMRAGDLVEGLVLGSNPTYTTAYDDANDRLFVSAEVSVTQPLRWFNPLVTSNVVYQYLVPNYATADFPSLVTGAVARDLAFSSDGKTLYVSVYLYDTSLAASTGAFIANGGAVAVFDLNPTVFGEPSLALKGLVRTCLGSGQIRRLPTRAGKADLFAITCDLEGALAILDSRTRSVVRYIGVNTQTGLPELGRNPFGLAVEPIDPSRAIQPVPGAGYAARSPCSAGSDCQRIYVASFLDNWVNILELDPDHPTDVALVKRIGVPQ